MPRADHELTQGFLAGKKDDHAKIVEWIERAAERIGTIEGVEQEDIVHDSVEKLLQNLQERKFNHTASLKTYAQSIASNTAITLMRARQVARKYAPMIAAEAFHNPTPHDILEAEEQTYLAQRIVSSVGEPCTTFLQLYFQNELSYAEIAERLHTTVESLRVRKHRCLEKARRIGKELV